MSESPPVQPEEDAAITEAWRKFLTLGIPPGYEKSRISLTTFRRLMRLLPMDPRCMICNAPFHGAGGFVVKVALGRGPSGHSPKVCNRCDQFAQKFQGGAEIELSMLFADVRGSTGMAETLGALEFSRLINRFFKATAAVLVNSNAMIDKLVGDEVIGLFVPGLTGPDHAALAIEAAQEMLRVTGHGDPKGPWISLGVGVHTGVAFVGAVGSAEGSVQVTALGDAVNTTARLASEAGPAEVLVSDSAWTAANHHEEGVETRHLQLKGRTEPVDVHVLGADTSILDPVTAG